jgi:3-hydroxyacyl-CoA dehydrogenase
VPRAASRIERSFVFAAPKGSTMSASYAVQGSVAVITLDNPPVNGLGFDIRRGVADALERAQGDAAIKAVLITGAGKAFSGGADIKEFG